MEVEISSVGKQQDEMHISVHFTSTVVVFKMLVVIEHVRNTLESEWYTQLYHLRIQPAHFARCINLVLEN